MICKVLVVDDDAAVREALAQTLELADLEPVVAGSFVVAKDHIAADFPGVIVSDIRMPGRDGFHLLDHAAEIDPDLPVILLTGEGDIPMAVSAMSKGAFGFLEKPCAPATLVAEVERALNTRRLVLENRRLKAQLHAGDPAARLLFGQSPQAEALRAQARRAAQAQTDVLVTGEPGTGISKVAEVVHLLSPMAKGPFIKRAAMGLGAQSVAEALQEAAGGSLFLDEVEQLSPEAQFALLDGLEQGGQVRLLAGSTSELRAAPPPQGLNPDLFYRLEVMQVRIPALHERPEDIPVLFKHYVAQASEQAGLTPPEITSDVLADLMAREWPGNARALMSAAMRFALGLSEGLAADTAEEDQPGLTEQMARVERSLLIAALRREKGRASQAAQALKLPRKTFYDKLARYGLRPEEFK
ncbi:MAG: sigma-54 dependent transcriptional regulator [Sediminimonas sp.]|uniref:sigma-54-dependent transcriptional regulator n=1 Tax=Sediminimonas sp. TaxID=2823379 RepID=UPI00286FCDAE|nr:sigma-54 dependent transcriptional regulator [Sediminimonas sp.]MDR9485506.1 sigma-54 dependent transcriptional regulator [Sediminimonas sp.]